MERSAILFEALLGLSCVSSDAFLKRTFIHSKEKAAALRIIGGSSGQSDPPKTGGQKAGGKSSVELKANG